MTDFSKTLVRASAVYSIMAGEGNSKTPMEKYQDGVNLIPILEAKYANFKNKECKTALETIDRIAEARRNLVELDAHKYDDLPLSEGCKSYLAKLYAAVKYGKWSTFKDKGNKYTAKGKDAEEESINLISRLDKMVYVKNDMRIDNEFVSGVPDIVIGDSYDSIRYVIDVKTPYDIETYIANLGKPLTPQYEWQIQTYMWLTDAERGEVSYCLVNMPNHLLQNEERRLFDRMGVTTEADPLYLEARNQLIKNLTFDDMPLQDKRIKFIIERDEEKHQKIAKRVEVCREYLQEIEKLHMDAIEFGQFQENVLLLHQNDAQ